MTSYKPILVGSRAARHWFADWPGGSESSTDVDYVAHSVTGPIPNLDGLRLEQHAHFEFDAAWHLLACHAPGGIASPDFLYTLKVSHAFWDVKWSKTITHIRQLKDRGARLIPELYTVFYRTWERVHGPKRAYLDVANEAFFTPLVVRCVPHDELHARLAIGATPMYTQLKVDLSRAYVSRSMFNALPFDLKVRTVVEEMMVLAIERWPDENIPRAACHKALKLLITSASKGWFPLFIVDNYSAIAAYDVLRQTNFLEVRTYVRNARKAEAQT